MQAHENLIRSNSLIARYLRLTLQYRYPRFWAGVRIAAGMWLIFLGAILMGNGFAWGGLLMVIGAMLFLLAWFVYTLVTSTKTTTN